MKHITFHKDDGEEVLVSCYSTSAKVHVEGNVSVYVNGELVYSPRQTFQVGDFVRATVARHDNPNVASGLGGKVVSVSGDVVRVEFPCLTSGHSANGQGINNHCWSMVANELELIDRPIDTTFPS